MSASVTLEQTNTVLDGDAGDDYIYEVACEVTVTDDISMALFVFSIADEENDDEFDHVATVHDLETYPATRAEAVTNGQDFYRSATVTMQYKLIENAQAFADLVQTRLQGLVNELPLTQSDEFTSGTTTYTFTTES